jgi:hypothetical protein
MSDLTFVVVGGFVVATAVAAFLAYAIYGGSKGSLSSAKIGEVYNFVYEQPAKGDPERYLAKVLDVCTLDSHSIRRLNARSAYRRNDPQFMRTSHLVTCKMPNGSVRNFYAERTKNCRKPLLAGTLFKSGLAAMMF